MTRFKSVLCASLLTLVVSSAAFGGNIQSRSGNIQSQSSNISTAPTNRSGNIQSQSADISNRSGNITDPSELVSDLLRTMFGVMGMLF